MNSNLPALHWPAPSLQTPLNPPAPSPLAPLPVLLCSLGRAGAMIAAHAELLRFKPSTLAPDLIVALWLHKPDILAALVNPTFASEEARHTFTERLGIADTLGMDTTAGSSSWLIALGESMLTDAKESARNLSHPLAPSRNPSHNAPTEGR